MGKVVFGLLRLKGCVEEGLEEDGCQSVKIYSVLPQFVITIPNYYYTCTQGTSKIHSRRNRRTRIVILAERGPSRLSDPEQASRMDNVGNGLRHGEHYHGPQGIH